MVGKVTTTVSLTSKTVTANGTYEAPSNSGYKTVIVSVPEYNGEYQ